MNKGFTLIELLVVVLIIGVLTAIALPQYQTATDKARFATIMPLVRALKDAQERYYLANGTYTNDFEQLDVQMPAGGTTEAEVDGTEMTFPDGSFVNLQAANSSYVYGGQGPGRTKNAYLMYLDHSVQPNSLRCIAYGEERRWQNLCRSLGGVLEMASDGYTRYLLP